MKKNEKRKVVWTLNALASLEKNTAYLAQRSPTAARRVRHEILKATRSLGRSPELFQLDDHRKNTNENIRRFFRWHYKIVYQVFDNEIVILDIIHTSRSTSP